MSGWLARLLSPLTWRRPQQVAGRLAAFARAEEGSRIDLCAAAAQCTDPVRAARYLEHARDEARHTRLLMTHARRIATAHGLPPPLPARADSDALFEQLGEADFLAFVHHGERRAVEHFTAYEHWFRTRDAKIAAVFRALLEDERRHATYSRALLVTLVGEEQARQRIRRAWSWELWQRWRRMGQYTARHIYLLTFLSLLPLLWVLALWVRVVRPAQHGWRR